MQKSTKKINSWRHNRDVKINIVTQITFIFNEKFLLSLKMPFFHSSRSHSQDTVERFWFNPTAWHRDVMTSRHDVTVSRGWVNITKLILPISTRRCARKMIHFCFYDTLGCWIRKLCRFCICMMTSRHDVMPWRQRHAVLISACRIDRMVIIFVSIVFRLAKFRNVAVFVFAWCHHVMTQRHDVTKLTFLYQFVNVLKWWYRFISVNISIAEFQTIIVHVFAWYVFLS